MVVRVELSAHVLEPAAERAAHRRHAAERSTRTAAQLDASAVGAASAFPAFRRTRSSRTRCRRFSSAATSSSDRRRTRRRDFSTSVDGDRRHADLAEGPAHAQDGRRPAVGAARTSSSRRRRPGRSRSATCSPISPGVANTGTPLASFLLGQVQQFSIDLQQTQIRNRAHFQEYFVQDDWRLTDRLTVNAGLRYTLNFPSTEMNDQAAVFNLETQQLEYLGRTASRARRASCTSCNFGPRLGVVYRADRQDRRRAPATALVWIEMAGITTPFTTPSFPFLQTVSQRTLDNITPAFVLAERADASRRFALTPDAGLGQGVFSVDRDLGSGYVQQWNASLQRELTTNIVGRGRVRRVEHHPRRHPRHEPESADRRPARAWARRCCSACRIRSSARSRARRRSAIRRSRWRSCSSRIPQYTTVSLYRNNVGTTLYHGFSAKLRAAVLARALLSRSAYTRSKLMDDASSVFDASILTGPVANYPVADSFNRHARARLLDRRHPARLRRVGGLGAARRRGPAHAS